MKYSIKIFYKIEIFYQNWKFLVTKSVESRFLRQPKLMRNARFSRKWIAPFKAAAMHNGTE